RGRSRPASRLPGSDGRVCFANGVAGFKIRDNSNFEMRVLGNRGEVRRESSLRTSTGSVLRRSGQAEDVERRSGAPVTTGIVGVRVLTDLRVGRRLAGDDRQVLVPVGAHVADRGTAEVGTGTEGPFDLARPSVDGAED